MVNIAEINEIDRLTDLRLLWRDLWQKTRQASFTQTLDWLQAYWGQYGQNQKLRVLVATAADKTIGILPLAVRKQQSHLGQMRVLGYANDGWGTTCGPVGPNPAATLTVAMRHLQNSKRDWDMIDLRGIDTKNVDRGRTGNAMRITCLKAQHLPWKNAAVIDMQEGWLEYWAGREPDHRRRYREAERALSETEDVRYVRYRPAGAALGDADPNWDLYGTAAQLLKGRATLASGQKVTDAARGFLRNAYAAAVHSGAADLNVLYVGGQPVGCALNFCWDHAVENVFYGEHVEATADVRTVLFGRMLQDAFIRGDQSFLFGSGVSKTVSGWETSMLETSRYTHFARLAPRAQLLRLRHHVSKWLNGHPQPKPATVAASRSQPTPKLSVAN